MKNKLYFKQFLWAILVLALTGCKSTENATEIVPQDYETISAELEQLSDDYGYDNALSELTVKSTTVVGEDIYYRMQQNYQGIPVYGKTAVYVENKDSESILVTGNLEDIKENIILNSTVEVNEISEIIGEYIKNELGCEIEELSISDVTEENLCIYKNEEESRLAYVQNVLVGKNIKKNYEVLVDAGNGNILSIKELQYTYETNEDLLESAKGSYGLAENGEVILEDNDRKIGIYSFMSQEEDLSNPSLKITVQPEEECEDSVRTLMNVIKAHDYFNKVLKRNAYDNQGGKLNIIMCPKEILTDQAMAYGFENPAIILVGEENELFRQYPGKALDVIAHEYTHLVIQNEVELGSGSEQNAISEGIADIFGNIIEGKQDDLWQLGEDAGYSKYSMSEDVTMSEYNDTDTTGHNNARILSHTAYLMWNGIRGDIEKKISLDELAQLWYRVILMMPSNCTFQECRVLVELAAQTMELSKAQIECIGEAFDEVGIYSCGVVGYIHELKTDASLVVVDKNGEIYGNYTMYIVPVRSKAVVYSLHDLENMDISNYIANSEETRTISTAEPCKLNLQEGIYTIVLTDKNNENNIYVMNVKVDDKKGVDSISIQTDFGLVEHQMNEEERMHADIWSDLNRKYGYQLLSEQPFNDHVEQFEIVKYNIDGEIVSTGEYSYNIETNIPSDLYDLEKEINFNYKGEQKKVVLGVKYIDRDDYLEAFCLTIPEKYSCNLESWINLYQNSEIYFYLYTLNNETYLVYERSYCDYGINPTSVNEVIEIMSLTDFSTYSVETSYSIQNSGQIYKEKIRTNSDWKDNNLYYEGYSNEGYYKNKDEAIRHICNSLRQYGLDNRTIYGSSESGDFIPLITIKVIRDAENSDAYIGGDLNGKLWIGLPKNME